MVHWNDPAKIRFRANGRQLVQNVLNNISSKVHASIGGLFNSTIGPEVRAFVVAGYLKKISDVNDVILSGSDFVVGKSVAFHVFNVLHSKFFMFFIFLMFFMYNLFFMQFMKEVFEVF